MGGQRQFNLFCQVFKFGSSFARFKRDFRTSSQRRKLGSLTDRGLLQEIIPSIGTPQWTAVVGQSRAAYCGIDPTADSLHVGNLLPLSMLMRLQTEGLTPVAVLGDVTARLGDPSGHSTSREPISKEEISANCERLEENLERLFSNFRTYQQKEDGSLPKLQVVRNSRWLGSLNVIDFLSTIGRSFRLETMLERPFVQGRLTNTTGMHLAEFKYEMFQAYDWCKLFKSHGCRIQIGGLDQLDNIRSGRDLVKKIYGEDSVGLITPIITAELGDKYGKTGGTPVWLSSDRTSAYELYQFFLRMTDEQAVSLVKTLTFATDEEVRQLIEDQKTEPEKRFCQKRLAEDVTKLAHGKDGLDLAHKATQVFFGNKPEILYECSRKDLETIFASVPCVELSRDVLSDPKSNLVSLSVMARLFPTEKDAKRIIGSGGLYLNMERVTSMPKTVVLPANVTLARVGKKNYTLIKWL